MLTALLFCTMIDAQEYCKSIVCACLLSEWVPVHTSLRSVLNTFLQTMLGSANILHPLEAAAAAALPLEAAAAAALPLEAAAAAALLPKFEEAAAAVADATSLPYSPPAVAAAAAAAPDEPNPCDFACSRTVTI